MVKIKGRKHDLGGGFFVHRILPQPQKRMVGPFCFLDHLGPVSVLPEQNIDVRPHPHIGLSTLTFLFEGRLQHRDSIGSDKVIEPGGVNWMTAGSGISHSERSPASDLNKIRKFHGLQFWIALPDGHEQVVPSFKHYPHEQIPTKEDSTSKVILVAGSAFGMHSPVNVSSPLVFAVIESMQNCEIVPELPSFEIALYVVNGEAQVGDEKLTDHQMLIFEDGKVPVFQLSAGSRVAIVGGEAFKTPRHIWWNLVSSSKESIEQAKLLWKEGRFPMVPGETEFIPLPES